MRLTARLFAPLLALTLSTAGCLGSDEVTAPVAATVETTTFASALGVDLTAQGWTKNASGLYYRSLNTPSATAATVANGQSVSVRYTGWLSSGQQFDSGTYPFVVGRGAVIGGWDLGIAGMKVGERRQLLIPPSLGYGASGYGAIPGNAVLVFNVEVLSAT